MATISLTLLTCVSVWIVRRVTANVTAALRVSAEQDIRYLIATELEAQLAKLTAENCPLIIAGAKAEIMANNRKMHNLIKIEVAGALEDAVNRAYRAALALALGLRQGEALGLRWSDVDVDHLPIRIAWQVQRLTWEHGCTDPHRCGAARHRPACPSTGRSHGPTGSHTAAGKCPPACPPGCAKHASRCPQRRIHCLLLGDPGDPHRPRILSGGLVLVRPKDGERIVPLPPELVPVLRAHRAAQSRARLEVGSMWADHDLVFTQWNGAPIDRGRIGASGSGYWPTPASGTLGCTTRGTPRGRSSSSWASTSGWCKRSSDTRICG